ncbi:hypothetical protein BLNAU_1659 [Blattamonas nauphoetae]|uniref:Uncharacterized protein n=1 Tax=Blattamonas nauphoetae TaxID=2049346 RepID=A0ABQ9YHH5_9EUKA|nr:hypothetical protein BLNAU_1659 [Blattamonas nauphoetae]
MIFRLFLLFFSQFTCESQLTCLPKGASCKTQCYVDYSSQNDIDSCFAMCDDSLRSCNDSRSATLHPLSADPFADFSPTHLSNGSDITKKEGYGYHEGYDLLDDTLNGHSRTADLTKQQNPSVEQLNFATLPGMTSLSDSNGFNNHGLSEPPDPNSGAFDGPFGRTPDSGFFHQRQERKVFDHDLDIQIRDRQKWDHQLQEVGLLWGDALHKHGKDFAYSRPNYVSPNLDPLSSDFSLGQPANTQKPVPTRTYRYTPTEQGPTNLMQQGIEREPYPDDVEKAVRGKMSQLEKTNGNLSPNKNNQRNRFAQDVDFNF